MKKINILLFCLMMLFLAVWVYLDLVVKLISIYWLIGELICLGLIVYGGAAWRIIQKQYSVASILFSLVFGTIWLGMTAYREIKIYREGAWQEKFGKGFNPQRRRLGTPIIPAGWQCDISFGPTAYWTGKNSVLGHDSKTICGDSVRDLDFERDNYNLKPSHGVPREVSIVTIYGRGGAMDSIKYSYERGSNDKPITRQQADSIFTPKK